MSQAGSLFQYVETASYQPLVDIYETDVDLVFEIELPGVDPQDVLIKVYDDIVIIEGVKRETKKRRVNYLCLERKLMSFRRILGMPVAVNPMAGRATYREGVVTLSFPKRKERVIKIEIET